MNNLFKNSVRVLWVLTTSNNSSRVVTEKYLLSYNVVMMTLDVMEVSEN